MISIVDERLLVEQCRKQDSNAQKILFEGHYRKMMLICLRYLRNKEDALETLNTAFLKVFSSIDRYKFEGSLEAWIKRIVINASIDFARKSKAYRVNFVLTDEIDRYGGAGTSDRSDEEVDPDLDLTKEELLEMVAELQPATRVVFNMYVVDGFSHRQIAKSLEISEGTSKWHLSTARRLLREKIDRAMDNKNRWERG